MRGLFLIALMSLASTVAGHGAELTDDTGRGVVMPDAPQRVIALHEPVLAVPLIELGVPVVAVNGRASNGTSLTGIDFIHEILGTGADTDTGTGAGEGSAALPGIGPVGNLDLEQIRALQPDVIVGSDYDAAKVAALSRIAPVYLQNSSSAAAKGFSVQADLAKVFRREDRFAQLEAAYRAQIDGLRGRYPDRLPQAAGEKSYLIVMLTDQVNVVGEMSGAVQALEDLGYRRAEVAGEGTAKQSRSMLILPVGAESLGAMNPDLLLVMTSFASPRRDESAAREALDRLSPGWDRFMAPAREGRVVFLDSAKVTSPSVASARHTLDAVESWLAAQPD